MSDAASLIAAAAAAVGIPPTDPTWSFEVRQLAMRMAFMANELAPFCDALDKDVEKHSPLRRFCRITAVELARAKDGRELQKATVSYEVPKNDGTVLTHSLDTEFFSNPDARLLATRCKENIGRFVYLLQGYEANERGHSVTMANGQTTKPSSFAVLLGIEIIPDRNNRQPAPPKPATPPVPAAPAAQAPTMPRTPAAPDTPTQPPSAGTVDLVSWAKTLGREVFTQIAEHAHGMGYDLRALDPDQADDIYDYARTAQHAADTSEPNYDSSAAVHDDNIQNLVAWARQWGKPMFDEIVSYCQNHGYDLGGLNAHETADLMLFANQALAAAVPGPAPAAPPAEPAVEQPAAEKLAETILGLVKIGADSETPIEQIPGLRDLVNAAITQLGVAGQARYRQIAADYKHLVPMPMRPVTLDQTSEVSRWITAAQPPPFA